MYRYILLLFLLLSLSVQSISAQVTLRVRITSGNSGTTCTDGFFGGAPEPHWRVNVAGQGWTTYPRAGFCFTNPPNTQYEETYDCPTNYPANLQVCFRAFEDDGAACIVSESCLEQICQNFPTPAPGTSANYSLTIPNCCGNTSWGTVNFTIEAIGAFNLPGAAYDLICNAVNLGILPSGASIGNDQLSNYGNFCATNTGEPNPWGGGSNQQGVWFQFTTGPNPAATIRINAVSDPQNLGDGIDLQLALYRSSNGSCTGALSLIREEYQGLGALWDEEMFVECLQPNTTYFLMVDGEGGLFTNNGIQGFFGLEIYDGGLIQSGDQICDAQLIGTVPAGGQIATAPLSQSNICATNINDPNPGVWNPIQPVWFSFVSPPSGHVIIDANSDLPFPFGTDAIDLQLALYSTDNNTCTGNLQFVSADYDPIIFDETLDARCLDPGRIYYLMVDGSGLNSSGIFDIRITDGGIPPAPNDIICNATALGAPAPNGTVGLNNQNNYCADNIFEPIPSNWGNDQGVWYTFIAPPSGKVEIRLESAGFFSDRIDLQVAVYDAQNQGCNDPLTEVMSQYEGFGLLWDETAEVECLIPGRLYYILVDGQGSLINPDLQEGVFDIEVWADPRDPAAPNDLSCNAIHLGDPTLGPIGTTPGPQHGSQNNFCATAAGEPNPSGFTPTQTVWYTFVAPPSGNVRIRGFSDNQFGGVDPIYLSMAVWETPGCTGPWREMISGRDLIPIDIDLEVFCLTPGETYYLQVDGSPPVFLLGWHEGYFDITINEIPPIPIAPNDLICDAIDLGNPFIGPSGATNQNNLCATDFGDPQPSAFGTDQTVWYTFVTPATGGPYAVTIDATTGLPWPFGSGSIDLQLAVFSSSNDSCTGTLTEVASDYTPVFFDETLLVQCLEENRRYFVMVDGSFFATQGYFDIDITPATSVPIPVNDLICDHVDLGPVPVGGTINNNVNYSNFCADTEPGEPAPFGIDQTVWFSFIAPAHAGANATSEVTVIVRSDPNNLGNAIDLQLAVYQSSDNTCNGTMSLVRDGSSNPTFSFNAEVNTTCLVPGRRYFVQVDGSLINVEGYFTIQVRDDGSGYHPPYDTICNAVALGTVPNGGTINDGVIYTNLCATTQAGEPNPDAFNPNQTVWFTFTAPSSGNVTIDLLSHFSDGINLQIAVYQAQNNSCTGPWLEIASEHNSILWDETLRLECLIPGQLYYIQVDGDGGFGGDEGNFRIRIEDDGGNTVFPYNNDICNAYNFGIPSGTYSTLNNETNDCANVQFGEPGVGSYADHTVWYQFTAPPSGRIRLEVVSTNLLTGMDPEVYLFASSNNSCTGSFTRIESSNWPTALITETIEATCLTPGNTYFIQVDGSGLREEGTFNIRIRDMFPLYGTGAPSDPEPTNNSCANAILLPVQSESCANGNGSWNMYNYGFPTASQSTSCGQNCGETWYSFTMPASGIALVEGNDDGVGPGFPFGDFSDLRVVAYTGSCGNFTQVACGSGGFLNDVGFEIAAAPGSTVYLQVFNQGGDDDGENFELCISEGCGADNCLNAMAFPIQPNIPYCFNTGSATGENVSGGEPGYFECGQAVNPEHSVYFYFVSDCNGSAVTLNVINAYSNGGCILGTIPNDAFNISFFQDATPCDNNPDALVDCQTFNSCMIQPINWSFTYNNLVPNTPYVIQIEGGFNFLGGDNSGYIMIQTTTNPVVIPTSTPAGCTGGGTATATTVGGAAPFSFLWSNGSTDSIATNLSPGLYTVTVTSSGGIGCFDTATVAVPASNNFSAQISSTDPNCANNCNGSATVNASGGVVISGYQYLWDAATGNQTTQSAIGLCQGTYNVTVSDNSGCTVSLSVTLGPPPPPVLAVLISVTDALCNAICDGEAIVSGSGGSIISGYDFLWPDGQTTALATGLCVGTYNVTVSDRFACADTVSLTISQPPGILLSIANQQNVDCYGGTDGSVEILAINGSAPYSFNIGSGATASNSFTALAAGNYIVTVTDANGCFDTIPVLITEPALLVAQLISTTDESCFGAEDGQISVLAIDGVSPYEFAIDGINFFSSGQFDNLAAASYTVTVRDANGCTATIPALIGTPAAITITLNGQTASGCGICNGTANISISGGAGAYSFIWSNGQTIQNADALCSGTNFVTVTDLNSCTASFSVNIGNVSGLTANASFTEPSCFGNCNGTAVVNPSGGTAPFSFLWNNSETGNTINGLCAGTYTVTITDVNACFVVENIIIAQPDELDLLAAQLSPVSCFGNADGAAVATVSGGTAAYSFVWSNAETGQNALALNAGPHSVTVTDANGCQASASLTVTEPVAFAVSIFNVTNSDCGAALCNGTAQISVTGGLAPYSYLWSNGNTTAAPTNLCPNFNDITVTDVSGCTATAAVNIPSNSTLGLNLLSQQNPSCFGNCNGAVTVQSNGGNTSSPYIYNWSNGSTAAGLSGLCAGTYRVTVSDIDACTNALEVTITEPSELFVTATVASDYNGEDISCFGASDGITSAIVSGGTSPYSFVWSNLGQTLNNSGLSAGIYTVTVTDVNGCQATSSATLTEPSAIISNLSVISDYNGADISCFAAADGIAETSATGGTGNYSYLWSNNQNTAIASGLSAGTYSVTVSDANGCQSFASINLTAPPQLQAQIISSDVLCFGASDGALDLLVIGGTAGYSYLWSNSATTEDVSGLSAGTFTVTVTDANSCALSLTAVVNQPIALNLAISNTAVTCRFGSDGSLNAIAGGGVAPYNYLWSNGASTAQVNNVIAGIHTLTVTDANGCSIVGSTVINQPATAVTANILLVQNILCNGAFTGIIQADALGGTPNYTFLWSTGATTQNLSALPVGTYSMTATDQVGCIATTTATISQPTPLVGTISLLSNYNGSSISCANASDGIINVSAAGGVGPYTYIWSTLPAQNTQTLSGLNAGIYTVTITDANGCEIIRSYNLIEPSQLQAQFIQTNVSCNGACNGQIIANALSGTGTLGVNGYEYRIFGPGQLGNVFSPQNSFNNLCPGNYIVEVRDGNDCVVSLNITITEPDPLVLSLSSSGVSCFGASNGTATARAGAGTAPYTYLWSNGQTSVTATGLQAAVYTVTVTDANNCIAVSAVTVTSPDPLVLTIIVSPPVCNGASNASASVSVNGGTAPYSYLWSNGSQQQTVLGLSAGTYAVTVTDANACVIVQSLNIVNPPVLTVTTSSGFNSCFGISEGFATLTPIGGQAPYTYLWNNGQTTATATGLSAGSYSALISDALGCQIWASVTVSQPALLGLNIVSTVNVSCNGGANGTATVAAVGGTAPYSYIWQNGQTSATATGLTAGIYSVTLTDANGCSATSSATINQPTQALITSMSSTSVSCKGGNDGSAQVAVNLGGTFPYSFIWSNGGTGQAVYNLSAGTYFVTLTDGNGCQGSSQVIVTEPASALTGYLNSNDALCTGAVNGQITAVISGGTLPVTGDYFYQWSNGQTGSIIGNLSAGNYTLTVTDANGCTLSLSRTVAQASPIQLSLVGTIDALCAGSSDGRATVVASGGTGTIYFQWSNGQNTPTATGLSAGTYSVTASDDNGCSRSLTLTIGEGDPVQISTAITNVSCFGLNDGRIEVTSAGASLYFWSNGQIGNPLANLGAGQYTLTIELASGCRSSFVYNVAQPDELQVSMTILNSVSCHNGNNASISANATGGTVNYSYLWSNGANTAQLYNLGTGNYFVTVTDANGCTVNNQISLSNPALLGLEISAIDVRCFGDRNGRIQVTALGGTINSQNYEYSLSGTLWQTGDLFPGLAAGNYTVFVRDANGCIHSDSIAIEAADPFAITFFHPMDTSIEYGDTIMLSAMVSDSSGALLSWWDINANNLLVEAQYNLIVAPTNTTIYEFRALSPLGCAADTSVLITVAKPRRAAAPSGFTPNGDGTNDTFFIQGDDKVAKVLVFRVYDRWGELVFEATDVVPNDPSKGWDGTFRGQLMNSAVYAWYAEVEYIDGYSEILRGDVTLLR